MKTQSVTIHIEGLWQRLASVEERLAKVEAPPPCERCAEYRRFGVPMPSWHEAAAREKIVRNIVQAKKDAGFPLKADFFGDVWPVALKALKGKGRRGRGVR